MANLDLRRLARAEGIPLWRIARSLAISEASMSRKLRHELPESEKARIREVIEKLKGGGGCGNK